MSSVIPGIEATRAPARVAVSRAFVWLSENVVTYESLIMSRDLPSSIAIVGAGAIGIEFAYVMANYGVEVTIIEFLPRALPNEGNGLPLDNRDADLVGQEAHHRCMFDPGNLLQLLAAFLDRNEEDVSPNVFAEDRKHVRAADLR